MVSLHVLSSTPPFLTEIDDRSELRIIAKNILWQSLKCKAPMIVSFKSPVPYHFGDEMRLVREADT